MARETIHVDARMFEMSGVGTYLQNMLSRMGELTEKFHVVLHGPYNSLQSMADRSKIPYSIVDLSTEPYALRPTFLPLGKFHQLDNLWVPHYNVPYWGFKRLVVTIHDILHVRDDIVPRTPLQKLYAKSLFRLVSNRANHISFVSHFSQGEFRTHVGRCKSESVTHIGISEDWLKLDIDKSLPPQHAPYLFFIGNLSKHKNLSLLLDTYLELPEHYPYELVIAGKLEGLRTIDSHPILNGSICHPRIKILGKIGQSTLENYMTHARALVFPSVYEGFGLPPLEAMAAGTQVVCSDIPVFRELYGSVPMWFDPYSKESLKSCLINLQNQEIEDSLRRDERKNHARKYSWDPVAKKQVQILSATFACG